MSFVMVDDLKQGMVLSEDVRDINSRLLLSKGQKIASGHLRILKIWGVAEVLVVGGPEEQNVVAQEIDPQKITRVKLAADVVFKNLDVDNGTVVQEIYRSAVSYRYRNNIFSGLQSKCRSTKAGTTFSKPDISNKMKKIDFKLPEAPSIIAELNQVIGDPFATSNDVAQVVHKSPSLASNLLKIVNSACYGFPSRIDRISRAVTLIGTREISGLALGVCVLQTFKNISGDIIDMHSFIRHSIACGIVARILAALKNYNETEQMFVSGLLHDIGKLIVYKYFPADAVAIFKRAADNGTSVYQSEKSLLGISHTHIGKNLLRKWKLPRDLENNIVYHHNPSHSPDPAKAAILQMADLIANALGIGTSGEQIIPGFDTEAWDAIGISNATIKTVIRQTEHQMAPLEFILR